MAKSSTRSKSGGGSSTAMKKGKKSSSVTRNKTPTPASMKSSTPMAKSPKAAAATFNKKAPISPASSPSRKSALASPSKSYGGGGVEDSYVPPLDERNKVAKIDALKGIPTNDLRLCTQLGLASAFCVASQILQYELTPLFFTEYRFQPSYTPSENNAVLAFCLSIFAFGKISQGFLVDYFGARKMLIFNVFGCSVQLLGLAGKMTALAFFDMIRFFGFFNPLFEVLGLDDLVYDAGNTSAYANGQIPLFPDFYCWLALGNFCLSGVGVVALKYFSSDIDFPNKTGAIEFFGLMGRLGAASIPLFIPILLNLLAMYKEYEDGAGWQGAESSLGATGLLFTAYLCYALNDASGIKLGSSKKPIKMSTINVPEPDTKSFISTTDFWLVAGFTACCGASVKLLEVGLPIISSGALGAEMTNLFNLYSPSTFFQIGQIFGLLIFPIFTPKAVKKCTVAFLCSSICLLFITFGAIGASHGIDKDVADQIRLFSSLLLPISSLFIGIALSFCYNIPSSLWIANSGCKEGAGTLTSCLETPTAAVTILVAQLTTYLQSKDGGFNDETAGLCLVLCILGFGSWWFWKKLMKKKGIFKNGLSELMIYF